MFARVLALVLPVGLVLGFVAWAGRDTPYVPSELVATQDQLLAEADPRWVTVGPSVAGTDVDLRRLGAELGLGRGVALAMNGSVPAHWYAMLRYRLFEAGYRPRLVLILAPLVMAAKDEPLQGLGVEGLVQHFREPDTILGQKVLGQRYTPRVERLLQRRAGFSRALLDPLRGALVGLAFTAERTVAAGEAAQAEASSVVFAGDQGRTGLTRLLPVVEEAARPLAETTAAATPLLADILDLVRLGGSRAVFVRVPLGPQLRSFDQLPPDQERATVELVREHGGGYLDMRAAVTDPAEFADAYHLNRKGRARLTSALAAALVEIGATGEGPMKASPLPVAPVLTRVGASPPAPVVQADGGCRGRVGWSEPGLARLVPQGIRGDGPLRLFEDGLPLSRGRLVGGACSGVFAPGVAGLGFAARGPAQAVQAAWELAPPDDPEEAWWIAPGGGLRVSFDGPPGDDPVVLTVTATQLGDAPPPVLRSSSGAEVPLLGAAGSVEARLELPAPTGPWWVELMGGAESWLLLRKLTLGESSDRVVVAGTPAHDRELMYGELVCEGATPLPPPTVHGGDAPWLEVPGLDLDDALLAEFRATTFPIEVLRDGVALARGAEPAPGTFAVVGGRIRVDAADLAGRLEVVHAERRERRGRWLAPGERCRLAVNPRPMRFPHRTLSLSALRAGLGRGGLHVRLEADGAELLALDPANEALAELIEVRTPTWRLEPYELVVWLDADAPHTLLTALTVSDG